MRLPRIAIGLVILALMAGDAAAGDPVPVKREAKFTTEYVRGHAGTQRPKLLKTTPPKYPRQFSDARIPGQAIVEFIINVDGVPEEVQYSSATDKAFGEAACAAVRKWRYQPAMEGGQPVRNRAIQRIDFNLR